MQRASDAQGEECWSVGVKGVQSVGVVGDAGVSDQSVKGNAKGTKSGVVGGP